ncbi:hypothetical protein SynRS9915_00948 [Synechococcus sp. RS9915]|nr:hypothetical protein SynRS9915_00948 [Synechococcus sp. RS9915]
MFDCELAPSAKLSGIANQLRSACCLIGEKFLRLSGMIRCRL